MSDLWPAKASVSGPSIARIRLPSDTLWTAESAENMVAQLYERHDWQVFQRRFRIRGSEIDLAVIQPKSHLGRVVEVKLRLGQPKIGFEFANTLLPFKKIAALKRGASALEERAHRDGLKLNWSFDMALVVPEPIPGSCLVYTWANAIDFN